MGSYSFLHVSNCKLIFLLVIKKNDTFRETKLQMAYILT